MRAKGVRLALAAASAERGVGEPVTEQRAEEAQVNAG